MPLVSVLNRYSEPVEVQFDALSNPESPYRWAPGEVKVLPQEVALFCRRKSVLREDPITGKQMRALLIQGIDKEYEKYVGLKADEEVALLPDRGPELLDRTHMDAAARAVTIVPIANPTFLASDREGIALDTHARRVP